MGRRSRARGHREGPGRPLGSYESCGRSQPPNLGRVFSVPFRPNPTALPCGSISDAARPRIGPKQPSRGLAPRPDPGIVYCLYLPARSRKSFPGRRRSRKIDLPGERRDPGKRSPARIPRRTGENTAAVRPRHLGPLDSPQPARERLDWKTGIRGRSSREEKVQAEINRLDVSGLRLVLKRRAAAAGIEGRVSGHSLRIGTAQSLAGRGATLVEMQIDGRWSSPQMPGYYARAQVAARGAAARLRYGA